MTECQASEIPKAEYVEAVTEISLSQLPKGIKKYLKFLTIFPGILKTETSNLQWLCSVLVQWFTVSLRMFSDPMTLNLNDRWFMRLVTNFNSYILPKGQGMVTKWRISYVQWTAHTLTWELQKTFRSELTMKPCLGQSAWSKTSEGPNNRILAEEDAWT